DIIKKIERARVKMEQIKPGSTLPRGKKEGGLTVKLFKGHYTRRLRTGVTDPAPLLEVTLHGEVLTLTHRGRTIRSEAKEKHFIKRADGLLSNRRLQREWGEIYSALTQQLIGTKQRPVIIVG
ncbi:MAG: hypothetical protein ACREYE_33065, partial [Gammaproteobacteria bacterium]